MALLKVQPGDVVAVPARKDAEEGFVLCRVINEKNVLTIEIFAGFFTDFSITEDEVKAQDLSILNRLHSPVHASFDFTTYSGKIKWPILLSNPDYDPEESKYSEIEFQDCSEYAPRGLYFKSGEIRWEPDGVRRNLEDRTIWSNPQLIQRTNLYLSGILKHGEPFNVQKEQQLIQQYGMDWLVNETNACVDLADRVATKFKESKKASKKKPRPR